MTERDETFTRRVSAVLLADVSGFTTLMGVDDEGTARAVRRLQALVQDIVADAKGRADAFAGDAIFAIFDSVVAAVDAALSIQRQIAAQHFAGRRLQVRMAVHLGDVLLREGAPVSTAVGDAVNVAARLQALAQPGTVCISDGVYRQVRNKFDEKFVDLGHQHLKNISEPVHAYLLVPREAAAARARPRRAWVGWAIASSALALVGALGVVTALRYQGVPPEQPTETKIGQPERVAPVGQVAAPAPEAARQVTLGVMVFKSRGGDGDNEWMCEALRDGLNTQLSELSNVKVYSKEFLDFLVTRQGLTEIEAANKLGITKMLTGSFVAVGGTLQIETHVVDVVSGVLESSYTTAGRERDFLDLQNRVVMGVISRLNLPVTDEEKAMLLARRNTNVEALKLLLEAEGGSAPSEPPADKPRSAVPQWLARAVQLGAVAAAANQAAEPEILAVIERYRRATEAKEIDTLAGVYSQFTPEQQAAQQRYFDNVRDLRVAIDRVDVAVVGDEAVVSYTRTDDFLDVRTGRPMHVAVRLTKTLRREDGAWKLAGGK
jgi:class 3 adenylate cyclase/TolB-like protein/ketosteroid isomerase-like protein